MSAAVLRRAAALMRERAEAATPGPWTHAGFGDVVSGYSAPPDDDPHSSYYCTATVVTVDDFERDEESDAEHIASWHPAVALAVADWLDDALEAHLHVRSGNYPSYLKAVEVARAYLNEPEETP